MGSWGFRATFGQICDSLKIKNQNIATRATKKPASGAEPHIEIAFIEQLTTQTSSLFLSNMIQFKGVAPRTINHYRQHLLSLCNWAMNEGGVRFPGATNPVAKVRCYKVPKHAISFLRLREIQDQFDALSGNLMLQTMVALYIYAGLRREEALLLTMDDFDWDSGHNGVIRVQNKEVDGEMHTTKTGDNRVVPISENLRKYLDRYLSSIAPKETWFFSSPGGCRWDPDNFSQLLRETNMEYGLDWSCLDFRHTFGSQLAMKGESLYKISKLMGNSEQICQKHYAHLTPESLLGSVEFPEADSPKKPPLSSAVPLKIESVPPPPGLRLVVNNSRRQ